MGVGEGESRGHVECPKAGRHSRRVSKSRRHLDWPPILKPRQANGRAAKYNTIQCDTIVQNNMKAIVR